MAKRFQRCIENFTCMHCGAEVKGNGYTNHCPKCLWSKHVDINPGDRAETCGGAMEPIKTYLQHGELIIEHRCTGCGFTRKNKTTPEDNQQLLYFLLNANS